MAPFDALIGQASDQSDAFIEPHPLWEYPAFPVTPVFKMMTFDMENFDVTCVKKMEEEGYVEFMTSLFFIFSVLSN